MIGAGKILLGRTVAAQQSIEYWTRGVPSVQGTTTFGGLPGSTKWYGGVLAPNEKICGIPYNSTSVLEIDPVEKTTTTFGSLSSDTNKWVGGVLGPNGKIYGIPFSNTSVLEIDPDEKTVTTFAALEGSFKWVGGAIASNGKLYGMPHNTTPVLEINSGEILTDEVSPPTWIETPYVNKF